jgi:4-amino-4-deoxy-L-arabinose transferase-like glycosyltransferase
MVPVTNPISDAQRYQMTVAFSIIGLVIVRLVVASQVPLAFDEALYWRWSQHLALGNLDHPPMTPLLIRAGTMIFGDTPLGVRAMIVLLNIPVSWAIWRAAAILFENERIGATAALYFNLTLAVLAGSLLATPDFPVVACSAFLLLFLAKLLQTGQSAWWLAIGAAFGLGMFSKYSMIFFAPSILIWLLVVPEQRRWLLTIWPWIAGFVALAIFSPVLFWNAEHGWASVLYQSKRLVGEQFRLSYLAEYPATQIGLLTPPLFILCCMAMARFFRGMREQFAPRVLVVSLVLPISLYFLWHALHGRVEGNWPMPMYPAIAVAAAVGADGFEWRGFAGRVALWSRRLVAPVSLSVATAIFLQAIFGFLPLGHSDPTARVLGAGWPRLAAEIDSIREETGAPVILTTNYGLTSWLSFYLPSHAPVEQIDNRMRWVNEPAPDHALFDGPALFICQGDCGHLTWLAKRFGNVSLISTLYRMRNGLSVASYAIYRVAAPIGPVLDSVDGHRYKSVLN